MKLFERSYLAHAFEIPLWGRTAEEQPPRWLVERIQSETLVINNNGGFTMVTPFGIQSCIAGDTVLLLENDTIEFCKPETFSEFIELEVDTTRRAA